MYEEHFGLREKPFSLIPDPEYLYLSPGHKAGLAMLEYGLLEQSGITVITGDVGAGKTTLIRNLFRNIDYSQLTVGSITNTHRTFGELMHWVASAYNIPHEGKDRVTLYRDLQDFFIKEYSQGRRVVLVVDEAQNIDAETLEELRLLSNINADKDQLIQIILVGQPELFAMLRKPELAQIAQRVSAEYHIRPLDSNETIQYVRHRVKIAGATHQIFDIFAILAIYYFSGGVPRLINTLCDYALVHAYAQDKDVVDVNTALEVVAGKRIGGVQRLIETNPDREHARMTVKELTGVDLAAIIEA
jgi:type II secretory pathway predicted ATPase ExeA